MHSLKYNAIINVFSKVMAIIFPIITIPYITRTLAVENYGMVTLSQGIIGFVALLAGLGISTYATRTGAAIRNDQQKINNFACEIFTLNVWATVFSVVMLWICIYFFPDLQKLLPILSIMSVGVILTTLGCDWVNNIYEDFTSLTIRTLMVQVISLVLLFLLVHNRDDQLIYASIGVFAGGAAALANAFYIRKYVKISLVRCTWEIIRKHIAAVLIFFFTQVAATIYVSSDTVILGFIKGTEEVAYYSISTKVYLLINTLIYAVIYVLLPRLSNAIQNYDDLEKNNEQIDKIFNIMLLITAPIIALVFGLSDSIINFLGGDDYEKAVLSLKILSVASFFAVFAGLYSACVFLPIGKEKVSLYCTLSAAFVNVIANFLFIPLAGLNAAAATTVLAELVGWIGYWIRGRKLVCIHINLHVIMTVILSCSSILMLCQVLRISFINSLLHCIVVVVISSLLCMAFLYFIARKYFYYLFGWLINKL